MIEPTQPVQRRADLPWDDPRLAVESDAPIRARYRALQSWYREHRLNARFSSKGPSGRTEPVGSLLSRGDVACDRSLNFLCDPEILKFAESRSRQVRQEGGAAERGRLFHNMLSSMPMAFDVAAVVSTAPDRAEILRHLFGLDVDGTEYVTAEWCPRDKSRRIGGTAFDIAVRYTGPDGERRLLGVETKYIETPGKPAVKPAWVEFSEECGWFRPGAADELAHGTANQLWRNVLLAARQEHSGICSAAHFAVVGLRDDHDLWTDVEHVRSWLSDGHRDRIVRLSWDEMVRALSGTSLASFAGQFDERYLDLGPLTTEPQVTVLRRSTAASESQRRRRFADAPAPEPDRAAMGDQLEWGRWLPTVWRAVGDLSSPLTIAGRPPTRTDDATAWWTPAMHLMLYGLGWPSPAVGLERWDVAGRPLDDPRLQILEAVYGRHLEALKAYLWHGYGQYEAVNEELGGSAVVRPRAPEYLPRTPSQAVTAVPNPATGGSDPLHLSNHVLAAARDEYDVDDLQVAEGDLGAAGPPRATLVMPSAVGWYQALHDVGAALPGGGARQGWRIDVVVTPIGHLGTYRQSRQSGRWFAGHHRWHQLGIPDATTG